MHESRPRGLGPVRANAGNQETAKRSAASGLFAENYREAARLASAVVLSGDRVGNAAVAFLRITISLNSLTPADAGTGTIPGRSD
jgi:hypothetical protein